MRVWARPSKVSAQGLFVSLFLYICWVYLGLTTADAGISLRLEQVLVRCLLRKPTVPKHPNVWTSTVTIGFLYKELHFMIVVFE